jgi:hypothetical protein
MIYGELGRYPLEIDIKSRIISFWAKLLSGKELKLSKIIYNLCYCKPVWVNNGLCVPNISESTFI